MLIFGFCRKGSDRPSFILASSVDGDDSSEVTTTESSSKEGTLESTEDVSKWGRDRSRGLLDRKREDGGGVRSRGLLESERGDGAGSRGQLEG